MKKPLRKQRAFLLAKWAKKKAKRSRTGRSKGSKYAKFPSKLIFLEKIRCDHGFLHITGRSPLVEVIIINGLASNFLDCKIGANRTYFQTHGVDWETAFISTR